MAAVSRRRLRYERERKGLFRAENDRGRPGCPAHGAGARGHPVARRGEAIECVHPHSAGALRRDEVDEHTGHAGRDHAVAALVSISSEQDFLLGTYRHRAASRPAGSQAAGQESARGGDRRIVPGKSTRPRTARKGAAPECGLVRAVPHHRRHSARRGAVVPGLACDALLESGDDTAASSVRRGLQWLLPKQVLDVKGDWAARRPDVRPGGWAFQYANAHYPDLDDTAMVVMALDRMRKRRPTRDYETAIARAREWIEGLLSRNGGWGAFDADNTYYYLNHVPFADHGALLDPPTEDVTARCISMLAQLGERPGANPMLRAAVDYLRGTQLRDGSWYGRWGMNYIYGTWSVLCALNAAGLDPESDIVRHAADWLISIQNPGRGWGEGGTSYKPGYPASDPAPSTASQTAWALLGLMAAGRTDDEAVARGIAYLARTQNQDGFWTEPRFTATGFPRVFYFRYHGHPRIFPPLGSARYRTLKSGNSRAVAFGM